MRVSARRVRILIADWFAVIAAAMLILGLIGVGLGITAQVGAEEETVDQVITTWSGEGTVDHQATVTEPNSIYPVGTIFEDQSVYPMAIAPRLEGIVYFEHETAHDASLDVEVSIDLVSEHTQSHEGEQDTLWRESRTIQSATQSAVQPGEPVEVPFEVDVEEAINRTSAIGTEFATGGGETRLDVTIEINGTVDGDPVDRTETKQLLLTTRSGSYSLTSGDPIRTTRTATVQEPAESSGTPIYLQGGPIVGGLALLGVATLVTGRATGRLDVTDAERRYLTYEDHRDTYDEWIVSITLPGHLFEQPRAEASSLESLVEFAIDVDTCVIEDTSRDGYFVPYDGVLYIYRPPPAPASSTDSE